MKDCRRGRGDGVSGGGGAGVGQSELWRVAGELEACILIFTQVLVFFLYFLSILLFSGAMTHVLRVLVVLSVLPALILNTYRCIFLL
jgi:hypothetical protein